MKKTEAIEKFRKEIRDEMVDRYRKVLECNGQIQYQIYVWEDGEIEVLPGPQGDNSYLKAKDLEPRQLFYICTIKEPFFDPWDQADHAAPDDEDERDAEEAEIIDWLVDEYAENVSDLLDQIIREAKMFEYDDDMF